MRDYRLVAVLLLTVLGNPAAAAQPTEIQLKDIRTRLAVPVTEPQTRDTKSKNIHKVLKLLGAISADRPEVRGLFRSVDERIDKGYFRFTEHQLPGSGGKIALRYRLNGTVDPVLGSNKHGIRRLELSYKPSDNSRWEAVATRKYVVVNYRVPLDKLDW